MGSPLQPAGSTSNRVRIVVATSVMLTFISYWRGAALLLEEPCPPPFFFFWMPTAGGGEGSAGRHSGQAQRLRPDVRLHPHWADLGGVGWPVLRRLDQRNLYHRRRPRLD